ncbi:MAG: FumA C-terminus/TtdB family hydratase beta subunit [Candidatus Omnitrophota bacterium]
MKKIGLPLDAGNLKAGDEVLFSGVIYTARDQAHMKLSASLLSGRKPPFDLKGQIIYYCGPNPAPKGKVIGSCGPTTSRRMDGFTSLLLKSGVNGMIGKGSRSKEVIREIKKHKAVYFITHAGCGALLAKQVRSKMIVAYPELGPEAIYRLQVKDFPLIVAVDSKGRDIYSRRRND